MTTPPANDDDSQPLNPYLPPGSEVSEPDETDELTFKEPEHGLPSPPWPILVTAIVTMLFLYVHRWIPDPFHPFIPLSLQLKLLGLELLGGVLAGLGLALLAQAMMKRKFSQLAPGHWVAIAALMLVFGELVAWQLSRAPKIEIGFIAFAPEFFVQRTIEHLPTAIFFLIVCNVSLESPLWQGYAWLRAVVHLLEFLLIPLNVAAAHYSWESLERACLVNAFLIMVLNFVSFLTFLIGLFMDWRGGVERDRWHWSAIGLKGMIIAILLADRVLLLFDR